MDTNLPLRRGDKVLLCAEVSYDPKDAGNAVVRVEGDFRDLYVHRSAVVRVTLPVITKGELVTVDGQNYTFDTTLDDHWAVVRDRDDFPSIMGRGRVLPIRPPLPPAPDDFAEVPEPAPVLEVPSMGRAE